MTRKGKVAAGRRYPERPIAAIGAVVVKGSDVLLVVRGKDPGCGEWSIPGGAIWLGETLRQAVIREIREEVSILVEPVGLVQALDRIVRDERDRVEYHYVLLDYLCFYRSGRLKPASDAAEARWVKACDVGRYELRPETAAVIRKGLQMAERRYRGGHDRSEKLAECQDFDGSSRDEDTDRRDISTTWPGDPTDPSGRGC